MRLVLIVVALLPLVQASADTTLSAADKLDLLYSNQFQFTSAGDPMVTIELASGKRLSKLGSSQGIVVRPDGEGSSEIKSADSWTLSVVGGSPAQVRTWVVVARIPGRNQARIDATVDAWKKRGMQTRSFETGTMFAVSGNMVDNREFLIAVSPGPQETLQTRAQSISKRFGVVTTTYKELVARPSGTVVATSGEVTVKNPSIIWFFPKKQSGSIWVEGIEVGGGGSQLNTKTETRRYFGAVYAVVGEDGRLTLVNAVGAETLLEGLVPSEIYPDSPMDALKAQAIAARTELLQKLGRRFHTAPFHLCSSQQCQVYSGAGREHPRTTKAIRATRGLALLDSRQELLDARYSAACGGHTEDKTAIWHGDEDPSLVGKLDAPPNSPLQRFRSGVYSNAPAFLRHNTGSYCAMTKWSKGRFRWVKDVSQAVLSRRVAATAPRIGEVRQLKPLRRSKSGRISSVKIIGSRGVATVNGDLKIRRLFGGLRSTMFVVQKTTSGFRFSGGGFGHGVGMCQLGAIGMAQSGSSYSKILKHYYSRSALSRLY